MSEIIKAITIASEVTGTEFSKEALIAIEAKLKRFPMQMVIKAVDRAMSEVTGRLTLAAIIERIDDGRPKADEAWTIALQAMDESITVVTNDEIAEAYGAAYPIFEFGDEVGARMAFRAAYERIVRHRKGQPPKWFASLGSDKTRQEQPIIDAMKKGLIGSDYAKRLLPPTESANLALAAAIETLRLTNAG